MVAKMERWSDFVGQRGRRVFDCLCPDGRRRTVRLTGEADTYFSIPATVVVRDHSVSGYVTGCETDGEPDYEFRVVTYGKNSWVFPQAILLPGATVRFVDPVGGATYWSGIISHWYRDNRPYWQGPPRWLVILSNVVWDDAVMPLAVSADDPETDHGWMQQDAEGMMKCIYRKTMVVEGGREVIGPQILDFTDHGGRAFAF